MQDVLTIILAGGRGSRLDPLTRHRAKPAVPFGGLYRIIDFALSNCLNSGLRRVVLLTQYKARSLDRHIRQGWSFLSTELGEYVEVLPPQQRATDQWYRGTADAIYHNIYSLETEKKDLTIILAGDHIYKMDYGEMIAAHKKNNADMTVGCIPIPISESDQFGVMEVDANYRIQSFLEKPATAKPMPGRTDQCLGSMGIYVFNTEWLFDLLIDDQNREGSSHDFGKDIIPSVISSHRVMAFPFRDRNQAAVAYWRDVGTLEAYYQANMDLIEVVPTLNLYDRSWPIRTLLTQGPPPKFVFNGPGEPGLARRGEAIDSMVCPGTIISGGHVRHSILSPNVRVNSYAVVEDSIIFEGVRVGRNSRIRNAIIDKEVDIPEGTRIGYDLELDRRRGFMVTDSGLVVIAKGEPTSTFLRG
ncbi:glucose-1-phosphate adenylyltransferase [Zavarzinella formosa]|uniref:glucose-1-phosphate adenylyltransferase n=1 Tax=Zavarzinella formosa TaxID=360055 RepID=UPI0002EE0CCF|nr:glucose-1-phosphate adenylyltransferase [Zavarzinella formosa]